MIAVFFVFRMRFYAAWCGAEAACISAGLGCYPEKSLTKPGGGPTVNYRCFVRGANAGEGLLGSGERRLSVPTGKWSKWLWGGVLYLVMACVSWLIRRKGETQVRQ